MTLCLKRLQKKAGILSKQVLYTLPIIGPFILSDSTSFFEIKHRMLHNLIYSIIKNFIFHSQFVKEIVLLARE